MKKLVFLSFALIVLFNAETIYALQQDSIQLYMRPDSIKSFEVVLPDDLGTLPKGRVEYRMIMTPFTGTWADLTERTHFSDENNTIIDAVRFSSAGRAVGECGEPFVLTISAVNKNVPSRTITGRACVSNLEDIDSQPVQNASVSPNSDSNIFDLGLEKRIIYASLGQNVQAGVTVQSYSADSIELSIEGIQAEPKKRLVTLDSANRVRKASFTLSPPAEGEHNFTITGVIKGCTASFCRETVQGKVVVSKALQEESGFSISLLPANLNIENLAPVEYTIRLENKGQPRRISVSLEAPEDIDTLFSPQSAEMAADSEKTLSFTAIPRKNSRLYQITAVASHSPAGQKEMTKKATAYLSTNELFTDAMRKVEAIADEGRQKTAAQLVDEWFAESGTGETNLGGYENLRERIDRLGVEENGEEEVAAEEGEMEGEAGPSSLPVLIPAAAVAAGGIAVGIYLIWRRKKADEGFEF